MGEYYCGILIMDANSPCASSWGLSPLHAEICDRAQEALKKPTRDNELSLLQYHWTDFLALIVNEALPLNIRIICVSAVKNLVYNKSFVDNPKAIFTAFLDYCLGNEQPSKIQDLVDNILRAIAQVYFTQKNAEECAQYLVEALKARAHQGVKIASILQIIVEAMEAETVNNEVLVGELFDFTEGLINSDGMALPLKMAVINEVLRLVESIVDFAEDQEEDDNIPREYMRSSLRVKHLLHNIILQDSTNQIITASPELNRLKLTALTLVSSTWIYSVEEHLFTLCVDSLIRRPRRLYDEQEGIIEKAIVFIERSLPQESYGKLLHSLTQDITLSLLMLLSPSASFLDLMRSDPEQYVQIDEDFTVEQQNEMLITRAGSLLSSLCMEIDGYLSFVGSLCIMLLKRCEGFAQEFANNTEMDSYYSSIDAKYDEPREVQVATAALVLSALSDQLEKRSDLYKPLHSQVYMMNKQLKPGTCKLPPYLICRLMLLTAFYPYDGCMDVFLEYKKGEAVFDCQLQSCYRILVRYQSSKNEQLRRYIHKIEPAIILSDHLTPLLEKSIFDNGETLPLNVQFLILEHLVLWMQKAVSDKNIVMCNKISCILVALIERFASTPSSEEQIEAGVHGYLASLYTAQLGDCHNTSEQYTVEIATAHVKKFPCLGRNEQRLQFLLNMGCKIVQKNNYILNYCFDLFGQILFLASAPVASALVELLWHWLTYQEQEEDRWEYLYLLEIGVLQIGLLGHPVPNMDIAQIQSLLENAVDPLQRSRIMMLLYSLEFTGGNPAVQQFLQERDLPEIIPPYENKPFLIYVIRLAGTLRSSLVYTEYLFNYVFQAMDREKNISKEIQQYEETVYDLEKGNSEVAINAFTKTRTLIHPLCSSKFDPYEMFRQTWRELTCKEQLLADLGKQGQQLLEDVLTRKVVNQKVRKIRRVKRTGQMEE